MSFGHGRVIRDFPTNWRKSPNPRNEQDPCRHESMGGKPARNFARDKLGVGNVFVAKEGVVPCRKCLSILVVAALNRAERILKP